ncbi:MAG: hypothetical protein ACLFUO_06740 [Candidatus Woesearchaeota archaeon]
MHDKLLFEEIAPDNLDSRVDGIRDSESGLYRQGQISRKTITLFADSADSLLRHSDELYSDSENDLSYLADNHYLRRGLEEIAEKPYFVSPDFDSIKSQNYLIFSGYDCDKEESLEIGDIDDLKTAEFARKKSRDFEDGNYEMCASGYITTFIKDETPYLGIFAAIKINESRDTQDTQRPERIEFYRIIKDPGNTISYVSGEFDDVLLESGEDEYEPERKKICTDIRCAKNLLEKEFTEFINNPESAIKKYKEAKKQNSYHSE